VADILAPLTAATDLRAPTSHILWALARWTVILGVVLLAAQTVWAARGLYADGSFFTWSVLTRENFYAHISRLGVHTITQAPLVLAVALGVDDMGALARLQSFGSGGLAILLWALALVVLFRQRLFWPMVVIFSVVFLNAGFMSIGEFNLAGGLVAVAAAILLRDGPLPRGARVGLVVLGIAMLATYESFVMLGPLLMVLVILRQRRGGVDEGETRLWTVWSLRISIGLFAAATLIAAINILFPRDPNNLAGAAAVRFVLESDPQLTLSVLAGVVYFALRALLPARFRFIAGLVLVVPAAIILLTPSMWAHPWMHYAARSVVSASMFVMLALAAYSEWRARRPGAELESSAALTWFRAELLRLVGPVAFFVALSVPLIWHTFGFVKWVNQVDAIVSQPGGLLALEETTLDPAATSDYGWPWTNPFLSQLLHEDGNDAIILSPGETQEDHGELPGPIPDRFETINPLY
jgi:hypothetical protein